ncbi:MAG: hypothetical protein COW24_03515 [Candidatus Kerfeldbacteria bacterium CG15_BIG_FIL_POST_REV_8_21_14_020_45_12]|uniref:YtxH domain-containing protein n=1 Tax=Candidatus Kerfeldbacteria bacterium CG15_BIG_FIL_POST_REV_8_21_14_020_45_12 TaxID=2014247 RepID=A0A2M7H3L6_9BACT|nr:MAG: hypothetical protein COW24_03515 [Candidatus Kerfeldbacteria bacterium CG15_BIG_FIL_POST_REV_8_21_14_020_45_12]PJA93069.1 MAG: hypothetical protein CO132_04940 [Candidatus Kerfeldbacteria bacterium CG_4_9_14_3_um_filter_45_8]
MAQKKKAVSKSSKAVKKTSKFLLGAGVAAAVAGGVVAFITQTKRGQQMAKKGREHATEIAKKVAVETENMKKVSREHYEEIVDNVVAQYQKQKKVTAAVAKELSAELKKEWTKVRKELSK